MEEPIQSTHAPSRPRSPNSKFTSQLNGVAAYLIGFIGLTILLGWIFASRSLLSVLPDLPVAHFLDGICLLLFSSAVLFQRFNKPILSRVACLVLLLVSIEAIAENIIDFSFSFSEWIASRFFSLRDIPSQRMSPNSALGYAMSSGVLLFYLSNRSRKLDSPALSMIGAVTIALGLTAIFGYITQVSVGYSWGGMARISLSVAVALILMGSSVITFAWRDFYSRVRSVRRLWRAITIYSTLSVLTAALLSSMFVIMPLYESLRIAQTKRLEDFAHQKVSRFDDLIRSAFINLKKYSQVNSREARSIMQIAESDSFSAVVRRSLSGGSAKLLKGIMPRTFPAPLLAGGQEFLGGPVELDSRLFLVVGFRSSSEHDNIDYGLIDFENLKDPFEDDSAEDLIAQIYLVKNAGNAKFLFTFEDELLKPIEIERRSRIRQVLSGIETYREGGIEPLTIAERPGFVAYASSEYGTFSIVVTADSEKLYNQINSRAFQFVLGAFGLALLISLGTFVLVRELVHEAERLEAMRRQQRVELEDSLIEKEVLLKEIHHRVKNNLQVVSSLLRLQLRSSKNPVVAEAFHESERRIQSISLLHELLYGSGNIAKVSMQAYISDLCKKLCNSFGVGESITLDIESDEIFFELAQALPVGLLINEVVTNSIKHAFPNGSDGCIKISFRLLSNGKYELKIGDNGIGYGCVPAEIPKSLGARLILMLTRQLRGKMSRKVDGGTEYTFIFAKKS